MEGKKEGGVSESMILLSFNVLMTSMTLHRILVFCVYIQHDDAPSLALIEYKIYVCKNKNDKKKRHKNVITCSWVTILHAACDTLHTSI
jgi:hypothetical protein